MPEVNILSKEQRDNIKKEFEKACSKHEVKVIPAKPEYSIDFHDRHELVGPYCRVSTMANAQVESYEMQVKEYTKRVDEHPNWTMVDIYADEGISATSMKRRKDFLRLIDDCYAHRVTLILTKSVTRFARNSVDCVTTCRKLKELNPPVGVFFETENIYTLGQNSEMMLNIYATLAQSDSETKSLAVKWGIRKRFVEGIPRIVDLYGYIRDKKDLTIDPATAPVVSLIYDWVLYGLTLSEIIDRLYAMRVPSPTGNDRWSYSSLLYILTNERYAGNVIMQKTYVSDIFSHRSIKNRGALPQYEINGYHPAIIQSDKWADVQVLLMRFRWDDFLRVAQKVTIDDVDLFGVALRAPTFE